MTAVVHGLEAIDKRAALQSHASDVGLDPGMGLDALHGHGQRQLDDIAGPPFSLEMGVAANFLEGRQGIAVDLQPRFATPARQADIEGELRLPLWLDGELDLAVPRITGRLPEHDLDAIDGHGRAAADEQIHVNAAGFLRVDVARQGAHDLQEHRRAARAACHAQRVRSLPRLQGILVEVRIPLQRDAAQDAVVEHALQLVGVARVGESQVHVVMEEARTDRRAGFQVAVVRQDVIGTEPLVASHGAQAADDVHPAVNHVVPEAMRRSEIVFAAVDIAGCDQPGAEQSGSHRMALDGVLLQDRLVILGVSAVALAALVVAPVLDPELGQTRGSAVRPRTRASGTSAPVVHGRGGRA